MTKKSASIRDITVGDIFIWQDGPYSGKVGYCCTADYTNPVKEQRGHHMYCVVILGQKSVKTLLTACGKPLPNTGWIGPDHLMDVSNDDEIVIFGKIE